MLWLWWLIWFVIAVVLGVWVYNDAERRGQSGPLWLVIVLLTGVIGLVIWLVVREGHPVRYARSEQVSSSWFWAFIVVVLAVTGFVAYTLWFAPTVVSVPLTGTRIPLVVQYQGTTVDSFVLYYQGTSVLIYSYTHNSTVMLTSALPSATFQYPTTNRIVIFTWTKTTSTAAKVRYSVSRYALPV